MVANVMPITQDEPRPQAAARLCNFPTGFATPLFDHKQWLDQTLGPILWRLDGTWVDIVGYASKLGNAEANKQLSARRIEEVRQYVAAKKKGVNFQLATALGEEQSLGSETNNDGYFRAVEVYVYGFAPPPLQPRVEKKQIPLRTHFAVRIVSAMSVGYSYGAADAIAFDIGQPKKGKWRRFWYTGAGLGIDVKIPKGGKLPKFTPGVPLPMQKYHELPPIGFGGSGPAVPFSTSRPCEIEDFEGLATVFAGPGLSVGVIQVGGEMGLSIESKKLVPKMAVVSPRVISLQNDSGLELTLGTVTKGWLTLM